MTDTQLDIINHCLSTKLYHSDLVKLILNLSRDDAQQLTEFVRCLVDGVICQQLLPRLFEAQETIVDVKLCFRPDVRTGKNATHYAVLAVMNDEYDEWQMLDRPVYQGDVNDYYLKQLPTYAQKSAFTWCAMLAYITNRHEILQLKLGRVDSSRATVFARFYDSTEVNFRFIVELPCNIESMLAELLADGYDLAALKPFLEV